jgi:hypothetical protein
MKKTLFAAALSAALCGGAHATNWVDAGTYSINGNSIQVSVDTHSRKQIGVDEYIIINRSRHTYPEETSKGDAYTTAFVFSRVRCDIKAVATMGARLVNGEGRTVYDSGELLRTNLPKKPSAPESMGYGIVKATCGIE